MPKTLKPIFTRQQELENKIRAYKEDPSNKKKFLELFWTIARGFSQGIGMSGTEMQNAYDAVFGISEAEVVERRKEQEKEERFKRERDEEDQRRQQAYLKRQEDKERREFERLKQKFDKNAI